MAVRAATESIGAQMAMMRTRSAKTCANVDCTQGKDGKRKKFDGLKITDYCSDECRYRAAYLRKKALAADIERSNQARAKVRRAKRKVRRVNVSEAAS